MGYCQRSERAAGSVRARLGKPDLHLVRLAQRVPVRIYIDQVPDGVRLVAGMAATVQIAKRFKRTLPNRCSPTLIYE